MGTDWRECSWGDLATLEYGKALRGYHSAGGEYQVYGTNGPIGWHSEYLYNKPSVIIGRKGVYRGVHYASKPFWAIDTAFYLKAKCDFDIRWAYYQLLTHDINSMDSGSAIPSTSRNDFYRLSVSLPPPLEQKAIAHILGTLDDKIELNQKMNKTLEAIAQAIFSSWFINFGPVRAKVYGLELHGLDTEISGLFPNSFDDSELGGIPWGWRIVPLDEIANFLNGVASQKYPPTDDDSLPVIKIAELRSGITDKTGRANTTMGSKFIVDNGDVLFSWSGSLMVKLWCNGQGVLNQHLFKVTSEEYPKWFFYFWTKQYLPDFQAIAADKATTMGHIKRHHLSDAQVVLPPNPVIQKGSEVITPLIDALVANEIQDRKLIDIRDALLPKLLSGEVRIKDPSKFTENLELNTT